MKSSDIDSRAMQIGFDCTQTHALLTQPRRLRQRKLQNPLLQPKPANSDLHIHPLSTLRMSTGSEQVQTLAPGDSAPQSQPRRRQGSRRREQPPVGSNGGVEGASQPLPSSSRGPSHRPRRGGQASPSVSNARTERKTDSGRGDIAAVGGTDSGQRSQQKRPRQQGNQAKRQGQTNQTQVSIEDPKPDSTPRPNTRTRRAPRFNSRLSEKSAVPSKASSINTPYDTTYIRPAEDDLTSNLIHDLSTPPYPDCPICFSSIRPQEPTFSCSPTAPIVTPTDEVNYGSQDAQCCWTTFHLKCIKAWASKSVRETQEAWKARGEDRLGVWRCPGCQAQRNTVPSTYRCVSSVPMCPDFPPDIRCSCFCGSTTDPRPPRLATPHSCANQCSRTRTCAHACPLHCHPGPCPPCHVTTQMPCFCGKKTLAFRCGALAQNRATALTCGQVCGRSLDCGNHTCQLACHDGPCTPCRVIVNASCYCGKERKELRCGDGEEQLASVLDEGNEMHWTGMFHCENSCDRPLDCGIHHCTSRCHVPSPTPAPCPRSPSLVHSCPCGKHELDASSAVFFPPGTVLSRTSCADPIPTCQSICGKSLGGCSHLCASKCHTGPCPPCTVPLSRPCRCGSTTKSITCSDDQALSRGERSEILCDKPCPALRTCGKHHCNRVCCPLAALAAINNGKGKKRAAAVSDQDTTVEDARWHTCDLLCGKMLSCGNHTCEEPDHRGPCPPCLRSSFEEIICNCGQTVLEPPIHCGTRMSCRYPCARPPLPCGHPKVQHACHEDPVPCPPCPHLTSKPCACGKKIVPNVRCSQEKISCGTACGKLLSCGFHHCERPCHSDACGQCHAVCGKPRKLCLPANHPCTLSCHAPAGCSEAEPCRATVTLSCPCGRIRQSVPCGRSTTNPAGREGSQQLKCSNECLIAKRNARLAEALRINTEPKSGRVTYADDLIAFARANLKFCQLAEKTFADFITSDKKAQVLPHMPEPRRNFIHKLASVYRMDTQMVDQEPHRSVQLIRRIDTRIPDPILSGVVSSNTAPSASLGRLAPLRAPVPQRAPPIGASRPSQAAPVASSSAVSARGWTSVVTGPTPSHASPSPTAWLTENKRPLSADIPPVGHRLTPLPGPQPVVTGPVEDVPDNWEDDL
ncbi:hypothetical protein BDW22DRAFT_428704 [Trametopsis cervina]|nr:hypothetical protein BDW22DRAFT_428704 [Trametopsis cervina]